MLRKREGFKEINQFTGFSITMSPWGQGHEIYKIHDLCSKKLCITVRNFVISEFRSFTSVLSFIHLYCNSHQITFDLTIYYLQKQDVDFLHKILFCQIDHSTSSNKYVRK